MYPAAIVFDLDGTLVDSRRDIAKAVNHVRALRGQPALPVEHVARYVGNGARRLLSGSLALAADSRELDEAFPEFLAYYTAHAVEETSLLPGVAQALADLARFPLGICTNKPRATALATLSGLGLLAHFRFVVAGGDTPTHKPDPAPLLLAAAGLGVEPHRLVMVGDGPQDVLCARAAGARSVGVLGGFVPAVELQRVRPDAVLDSLAELPALIDAWSDFATGSP